MSVAERFTWHVITTRVAPAAAGLVVSGALALGVASDGGALAVGSGQPATTPSAVSSLQSGSVVDDIIVNPVISRNIVGDGVVRLNGPQPAVRDQTATSRSALTIQSASFWGRTWDYTQCVFGAGVPIGVAMWFAAEVGTRALINVLMSTNRSLIPGVSGPMVRYYATQVWNACNRFINS